MNYRPTRDDIVYARALYRISARIGDMIRSKYRDDCPESVQRCHEEMTQRWVPQWTRFQDYCQAHNITKHMI